jgi:chorismate dehydratase
MIRVAAVSYLNARPLVEGMTRPPLSDRFSVAWCTPAECARRLHEGDADLALLPSIEYARSAERLEIVPGVAIGSKGPVRSVLLYTRVPLPRVRSIALNAESRTSNALVTVLFAGEGARPALELCEPDLGTMLESHDAALLIGDAALFTPAPEGVRVIDLGEAWTETQGGLPFVYAFWVARPGVLDRDDYRQIHASKAYGRAHLRQIAEDFEFRGRRDPGLCHSYLSESVRYRLGNRQIEGLETFYRLAARHGLIEGAPPIRFLPLSAGATCGPPGARRTGP